MKIHPNIVAPRLAAAVLAILGAVTQARAGTVSSSPTAPAINDADLANYGAVSGTDKWWVSTSEPDSHARGQTFTTGPGALRLKSITYQTSTATVPSKNFRIRVGKISGTTFTETYSETATQNANWNAGDYVTWTFSNPPLLDGGTVYGVDVGMTSSTLSWTSGIPYLNLTDNEFPGGARYTSGTTVSGIGSTTVLLKTGDTVFHLDLETPLGGGFDFVAGNPPDNESAGLIRPELVATFSRNLVAGSGNITIRNLTNSTDVVLSISDPAVSISGNLLKIQTAGLINWNKSYAVRIAAGAITDQSANPFAGIADDTTWNFATAAGDPFLDAVASLKSHINGIVILNATQIAEIFDIIVANKTRFPESAQTIGAVFDLVAAYDVFKGPSALLSTGINFGNRDTQAKTLDWTIYQVMQTIMDEIYTPATLADHPSLLNGFKLGVSANFPGSCAPPANPLLSRTVPIQGSFDDTFGRATQQWTSPARKPTGTYLAPGTIATVTVPPALVNAGYKVRVGCNSWDLSSRTPVKRLERATRLYPISATTIQVASPYGGGIYIEVPFKASAGVVNVTVTGAVRSPYFSAKSFHQTTPAEWDVERTYTAPWADFQSDKFMTQVPRKWIYNHPNPAQMMADWDAAMDAINSLMGFPINRGKETMYCQPDVILRSSVHAPGYPAVNNTTNPNSEVSPVGYAGNYLVRGPNTTLTASNIEFHEQGHAYGFPKFGGESESNVNLLQPAMLQRKFGRTFDEAQNGSFGGGNAAITMDNTAVAWMCVFNFSPRKVPMADAEKAYQHKGHAKFMDVARLFGWQGLDDYWHSFMVDDANNISYATDTDALLLRLSRHVGKDIRPLLHFWGIYPQNPSALAAAIAAENIPASTEIRSLLARYKTLVPADNAAFRTFATAWRGKKPSITGNWEEREHARQWDTQALYGVGDQQRSEATNPGEIYNENSANDIRNRVQELLDLYYPSGIKPAAMTFAIPPSAVNATTIGMTATTATAIGPVEYYFENLTNVTNSGWITSPTWQQGGLTTGQPYSFRVKARDSTDVLNETTWSPTAIAATTLSGDVTGPSPNPMTFATPPTENGTDSITMTATVALDVNGVEYSFENTSGGGNSSGWQDSPTYTDTNLSIGTTYSYRVRARDKSPAQNANAFSPPLSATTEIPDFTPPSPNPMSWASVPTAAGPTSITMTATTATDLNDVEYYFECLTPGGHDSDWQDSSTYTDTGLERNTEYSYQVRARDKSSNANETTATAAASAVTFAWSLLTWDSNGTGANQTDGTGAWLDADKWSDGSNNAVWTSGDAAIFGNGGAGAAVTLAGPTAAASLTFNTFTGTYTLGTAGQTITLNGGITKTAASAAVTLTSPVALGAAQSWTNASSGLLTLSGAVDNGGKLLTIDGSGNTTINGVLSGAGGITKTGPGKLGFNTGTVNSYNGTTTINGGVLMVGNIAGSLGGGNLTLNGGVLEFYYGYSLSRTLGSGANQVRILGGSSGFGGEAAGQSPSVNLGSEVQWGSSNFNPDVFVLGSSITSNINTHTVFSSGIDLNGAPRTVSAASGTSSSDATISGVIRNSTGTAGLTKSGPGTLILSNATGNTYNGGTIINSGGLRFSKIASMPNSGNVSVNHGTILGIALGGTGEWSAGTSGVGTLGGLLAGSGGAGSSTVSYNGNVGLELNVTTGTSSYANTIANIGTSLKLLKIGTGTLALSGNNSYSVGTDLLAGTLSIGSNTALGSGPLTISGGTLQSTDATTRTLANSIAALNGNVTVGGTGDVILSNSGACALVANRTFTINNSNTTFAQAFGGAGFTITKAGTGSMLLTGNNTYTGTTTVSAGKLFINGNSSAASGAVSVSANATIGGNGTIGGATTIAIDGKLEFNLSTAAISHDKLDLATGKALNFSGASVLTITSSGGASAGTYTLVTAPGGITGNAPATLNLPAGWAASVAKSGNDLVLNVTSTGLVSNPYDTWAGGPAFAADTNNDGIPNGMAWLLGAATPSANATALLPTIDNITDPVYFIFTYRRSDTAAANTTVAVQYGSTPSGWTTAVPGPDIIITPTDNFYGSSPGIDKVEVKIKRTLATGGKLFARLNVVTAP